MRRGQRQFEADASLIFLFGIALALVSPRFMWFGLALLIPFGATNNRRQAETGYRHWAEFRRGQRGEYEFGAALWLHGAGRRGELVFAVWRV